MSHTEGSLLQQVLEGQVPPLRHFSTINFEITVHTSEKGKTKQYFLYSTDVAIR